MAAAAAHAAGAGAAAAVAADADAPTIILTGCATSAAHWLVAPRSPTLGGTVSLRAAQACPPVLAGNAFGLALSPPGPLRLKRGLRSVEVAPEARSVRAVDGQSVEIAIDTGIVLDEVVGAAIVVERPYNRRDLRVDVPPQRIRPGEPLVLRLVVRIARGESVELRGELSTLCLFLGDPRPKLLPLASAPAVGRAHAAFFDAKYFAGKRGGPTKKYQRTLRDAPEATPRPGAGIFVVHAGGAPPRIERGPDGVPAIVLPLEARTRLSFHGQRVEADIEPAALAQRARTIEAAFRDVLGDDIGPGALRYFTTYVSPHVAGDPHAFFKPATLVAAPPEVRLVVDGPEGEGIEGLRGVTEPAWFHAMPAVARVLGRTASMSPNAPILRARFTRVEWLSPRVAIRQPSAGVSNGSSGTT